MAIPIHLSEDWTFDQRIRKLSAPSIYFWMSSLLKSTPSCCQQLTLSLHAVMFFQSYCRSRLNWARKISKLIEEPIGDFLKYEFLRLTEYYFNYLRSRCYQAAIMQQPLSILIFLNLFIVFPSPAETINPLSLNP